MENNNNNNINNKSSEITLNLSKNQPNSNNGELVNERGIPMSVVAQISKRAKSLYNASKKNINESEKTIRSAINKIEYWVKNGENQRNFKMKSEFEREKEYKLEEQSEIKNQIEILAKNNINEKLINNFNVKISQQQDLFNKYYELKKDVLKKIDDLKSIIPLLEKKVKTKNEKLKKINKENLKLLEQIKEIENFNTLQNSNLNISNNYNNISYYENSQILNDKIPNSININELIENNNSLKEQYFRILKLRKEYLNKKNANINLVKQITDMNTDSFLFKKIFEEGFYELSKEILKINELQLDKVISYNNSEINTNSMYFEMIKQKKYNNKRNDEELKLPIINNNIIKKYNYPLIEKSNPNNLIYRVIKNIVDESHITNKKNNMKKNKFKWDEFRNFSAYQIYTILNMNREIIKKLESQIFPRKIIFNNNFYEENKSLIDKIEILDYEEEEDEKEDK